ncbi:MAG: ABC transporter substrate-binding protein [Chloroflexota bacterium]|nr:ABC transporter substrate-binding protein [Chloroflexota bacterium]
MADEGNAGISDDRILFGQSAAFSGPAQALGRGMRLGIQAAFHERNQTGGVHGRMLELTTLDDQYEPHLAYSNTLNLISRERVFALIGEVGTPTSRSASPLANAEDVPFIAPFTGAGFLREAELENVVNLRASYHQEAEEMVARLTEDLGITRVAVMYQNDSYGQSGLDGVVAALPQRGLEPVASWYYQRNSDAVKAAVFNIVQANPEAVIMIGAYAPVAKAITLAREDIDPIFMAVSFVGSNALAQELGPDGAGVYVTQVVPLPDDTGVPAVAAYRAALKAFDANAVPGFVSLEGYLAGLQGEVDGLVAAVQQSSAAAAGRYGQAVSNGRIIILVIAIVGIVGTLLVAGYSGFKSRRGISAPLAVSSLGALAIFVASAVAGWLVIDNLEAERRGRGDVEVLAAAAEVTRRSSALASTASVASNARMTPDSSAAARAAIASNAALLADRLTALAGQGYDGSVERIGQQVNRLTANVSRIEDQRPALLEAILVGERSWQELSLSTNYELFPAIGSSLDNQFYYMMTGRSDFRVGNPSGFDRLSKEEYLRYWHLATLMESVSRGYWTLDFANRLTIPALAARVEETFDTAAQRMERSIAYLAENGGPELSPEVIPLANRLLDAGAGENSALAAMKLRTSMVARERQLIGANRQILAGLQGEVDGLVAEVRQSLAATSARYGQAASNGRIIILVIAVVGIVGTLLVAGYNSVRGSPS